MLVIAIPILLYVPFIQDWAREIALEIVNKDGKMKIDVGYLRLKFPLNLEVDGVAVMPEPGDTMVTAGKVTLDVKMLPLLKGEIELNAMRADSVFYQMGTVDSLMWLRAHVTRAEIDASALKLKEGKIDVDRAMVEGADISLIMKRDTVVPPVDTTKASTLWVINARDLQLRHVAYRMSMMPTIDSLAAYVEDARLSDGIVDMTTNRIHARSLVVDSVTATYLYPSAEFLATHPYPEPPVDTTATDTKPWTITADHLRLTGREATYAERGATPLPGLDMAYIQARDIVIEVDSFYNCATDITVPIKQLSAIERCSLPLNATGVFAIKNGVMTADDMVFSTTFSRLAFNGEMGVGDLAHDPNLPIRLAADGNIAMVDVKTAYPMLAPMVAKLPAGDLALNVDIDGTSSALNLYNISARLPRLVEVDLTGRIENFMNPDRMEGNVSISGWLRDANALKPTILEARLAKMVNIPDLDLNGTIDYRPNLISGTLEATTPGGEVAMEAEWDGRAEGYGLDVTFDTFPVNKFLPTMGIGSVTGSVHAHGEGYNPLKPGAHTNITVEVDKISVNNAQYRDIVLDAQLLDGDADGTLVSHNPGADLDLDFVATLDRDSCTLDLDGTVRDLNLRALGLTDSVCNGAVDIKVQGVYNPPTGAFDAMVDIADLNWHLPNLDIKTARAQLTALSNDSTIAATISNGDLRANFISHCSLDSLLARIDRVTAEAQKQVKEFSLDVDALNRQLPDIEFNASAGRNNLLSEYLSENANIQYNTLNIGFTSDSLIRMNAKVTGILSGTTAVDTIAFNAHQSGAYLIYAAYMNNRPGTFDNFAYVGLNGFVAHDRLSAILNQNNIKGEKGFQIGLRATMADSVATVKIVPYTPTIAYQEWTVNRDNFVSFDLADRHLDANLQLSNDKSAVKLFTEHVPGDTTHSQEDIMLELSNIKLQDWLSISPFAPPIKGDLGANLRLRWDSHDITGTGTVGLNNFYYGREKVGDFDLGVDITRNASGALSADVSLMVDSIKTITARGVLNDSTLSNPFLLDFKMIHFPLKVVNPFLPPGVAKLSGSLNGRMDITGDMTTPIFNGFLSFDSAEVKVTMLGTSLKFASTEIPVDSNVVSFNKFAITACNDNPLTINGTVDARHITDIGINLSMNATDMMVVNATRARGGSDVYGKAYVDIDAKARGNLRLLMVDASLAVLEGTNVTYVIPDASTSLTMRSNDDMVKFVQFNDTTAVVKADSISTSAMALFLDANLDIHQGATISVDLSADGKNKAQLQPTGKLTYSLNPMNDGRLTGRLNINSGFARYTPPFMSEKLFNFIDGSYVAFNGDMMNPLLNIKAVDQLKANVTQEGQNSRLVNFDVTLSVTGSLSDMNVSFDLSTGDDITVQNELSSMSPEQRATQAMNLLLYNVYVGAGTKANANLYGNPLYSFLESQVNTWMANNVKGVDISFGIDQYDKTLNGSTSTTTSYSYRVSKTLFNDRFKIIVGGNYSTDADADENFSQNLINDISFEYMLNRSGSMYVKIFRHVGYESILEGEVTQTGVGFVLKRKIPSLLDMFGHIRRRPKAPAPTDSITIPLAPAPKSSTTTTTVSQ